MTLIFKEGQSMVSDQPAAFAYQIKSECSQGITKGIGEGHTCEGSRVTGMVATGARVLRATVHCHSQSTL
jgi:hypothetical protein